MTSKRTFTVLLAALLLSAVFAEDCSNFNGENACQGNQTVYPESWNKRSFQTPLPGDDGYHPAYEYLGLFACYTAILYDSSRTSATIDVRCKQKVSSMVLQYQFGSSTTPQSFSQFAVTSTSATEPMTVIVSDKANPSHLITLEPLDFLWMNPEVPTGSEYNKGQKGAIIEMFGWPYKDIEAECEAISKMGYLGVKVFPPQESVFTFEWPQNGELNPWWFYYQPVSYKLHGRHGTRDELRSMINTCRKLGVRVYADAVVNHMSGDGNDVFPSHRNGGGNYCTIWGAKNSTAYSPYYTQGFMYYNITETGLRPGMEYPSATYTQDDFHCERPLNAWNDPFDLNYGWLTGLADLNTESDYVQERIASYFTDLLSIGFSGFRMDAAKHISPKDISAIFKKFKTHLGGGELPDDFITYLEVLIGGEKQLLMCQEGDYNYAVSFAQFLSDAGLSQTDIGKIKIWESAYPKEFPICGSWVIPSERFVAENDCADDQNPGSSSRDMQDKGSVLIKEKNVPKHRGFEVELFTRTDGDWQIKLVLSSYSFMNNGAQGIPDGFSDCSKCVGAQCNSCTKSVPFSQAHNPNVCGYTCEDASGNWLQGVYTRVHRDMAIINAMRQWMSLPEETDPTALGLPSQCTDVTKTQTSHPEAEYFLTPY
eukprot:CAMPEP_0114992454 /NCGR_PEP_ID=MMETSP0216-20121206/11954_1 /TAXON_ID=223996 /ORGANISM="Protocruzia adherens, Strain Boccale" /LENGTH=651 /DNA_ID=CAMNT_0002355929 /DNA_START=44 /DNA_END=1999 /DNA_ORIENTATION=-